MLKPIRRLAVVIALMLGAGGTAAAQAGASASLHPNTSTLLSVPGTQPSTQATTTIVASGLLSALATEEGSAFTSAVAELFAVPVNLSRIAFSVDNALGNMKDYRTFEYVSPRIYSASRVYRVTCAVIEF